MKTGTVEYHPFEVTVPDLSGEKIEKTIAIKIPVEWDDESKEWLMTEEGTRQVEETKARAMGLVLPAEMKSLRKRLGFTQKEMGELFQVGGKSWTRWESGRHRPSRVISLLVRALYEDAIPLAYLLERSGKKARNATPWTIQEKLTSSCYVEWSGKGGGRLSGTASQKFQHFTERTGEQIRHPGRGGVILPPSRPATSSASHSCLG